MPQIPHALVGAAVIVVLYIVSRVTVSVTAYAVYGEPEIKDYGSPRHIRIPNTTPARYLVKDGYGWETYRHEGKTFVEITFVSLVFAIILAAVLAITHLVGIAVTHIF